MGWLHDAYGSIVKKFAEEKKQLKESSGLSAYIAQNFTTVVSNTAKGLGNEELSQKIEEKRQEIIDAAMRVDDKVREEYQQYLDSDGFTQYVAANMITVAKQGATALGNEELVGQIEGKRVEIMDVAKLVDDKVKEEVQQYKDSDGFSQYIAGNVVSLAEQGSRLIGKDEWASYLEENRGQVLDGAKLLDDKVREEIQQYKNSDGLAQYVAQNVSSLGEYGASALGREDWVETIEENRNQLLDKAKKFDDRVREETDRFAEVRRNALRDELKGQNADAQHLTGRYALAQERFDLSLYNTDNVKNSFITSVEPLYAKIEAKNYNSDNNLFSVARKKYDSATIKIENSENDKVSVMMGMLDGNLHGAVLHLDENGDIGDINLYNHGQKINTEGKKIEVVCNQNENGDVHYVTMLDGNKFGWELVRDKDGNARVAFYDEKDVNAVDVQNLNINEEIISRKSLAQELKSQKGDIQKLTGQYALSQAKCDLNIHNIGNRDNVKEIESSVEKTVTKTEHKVVVPVAVIKGDDFSNG